jgi:hypothetical protein
MSYMPPAGADRRLPRIHLLVLNRSFRRALEAENKSPRTMQAYTDAVRLLAAYYLQASPMDGMRPPSYPSNPSMSSDPSTSLGWSRPARGATLPAAAIPPSSCCWSTPACAGRSALA